MKDKILGHYGTKAVESIIKIFTLSEEGLRESVYLESRFLGRRRYGCQDVKPLSVLRTKIASDSYPHLSSLISEGVNYRHPELVSGSHQMLKYKGQSEVQHDVNSLKRTYSQNRIRPITLALSRKGRGKCASPFTLHTLLKWKAAFTLAEVLITLGIIGVVAAMTMPVLIQNHRNSVVEARLKKFYSTINQAIIMAENDYDDKKIWYQEVAGADIDDEGNPVPGSSEAEKWFNKYFAPYLKIIKKEILSDGSFMAYFTDGSAVRIWKQSTHDWYFYPVNPQKCIERYGLSVTRATGRCVFLFNFEPNSESEVWKYHYNKGLEPYKYAWDGDIKKLYTGTKYSCASSSEGYYCTALIQMNGWKIPKDYPQKISY